MERTTRVVVLLMSPSWKSLMECSRSSPPMATHSLVAKTNWLCKGYGKQPRKRKWNLHQPCKQR
ncbi:unnamed protein product [Musa acuminata subsp. malaccensis]|uniref:(wild Malaysian banana) hypothetical protein n=1 Tax=Musa acuminata subsp. malaccensis TaxID=214687 RepID=A0A804J863_MUSAM|nr:unnamed protein product [Musa acuminata subsp. malaccensis]